MTKTHVQIPDELYKEAKRVAEAKEWSFAEVVRRGLEHMTTVNRVPKEGEAEWKFPVLKGSNVSAGIDLNAARDEMLDDYSLSKINTRG